MRLVEDLRHPSRKALSAHTTAASSVRCPPNNGRVGPWDLGGCGDDGAAPRGLSYVIPSRTPWCPSPPDPTAPLCVEVQHPQFLIWKPPVTCPPAMPA